MLHIYLFCGPESRWQKTFWIFLKFSFLNLQLKTDGKFRWSVILPALLSLNIIIWIYQFYRFFFEFSKFSNVKKTVKNHENSNDELKFCNLNIDLLTFQGRWIIILIIFFKINFFITHLIFFCIKTFFLRYFLYLFRIFLYKFSLIYSRNLISFCDKFILYNFYFLLYRWFIQKSSQISLGFFPKTFWIKFRIGQLMNERKLTVSILHIPFRQ